MSAKVDALYRPLCNDQHRGSMVTSKMPQGSWAHKTSIKAKPNHEYDADVLLELDAD